MIVAQDAVELLERTAAALVLAVFELEQMIEGGVHPMLDMRVLDGVIEDVNSARHFAGQPRLDWPLANTIVRAA